MPISDFPSSAENRTRNFQYSWQVLARPRNPECAGPCTWSRIDPFSESDLRVPGGGGKRPGRSALRATNQAKPHCNQDARRKPATMLPARRPCRDGCMIEMVGTYLIGTRTTAPYKRHSKEFVNKSNCCPAKRKQHSGVHSRSRDHFKEPWDGKPKLHTHNRNPENLKIRPNVRPTKLDLGGARTFLSGASAPFRWQASSLARLARHGRALIRYDLGLHIQNPKTAPQRLEIVDSRTWLKLPKAENNVAGIQSERPLHAIYHTPGKMEPNLRKRTTRSGRRRNLTPACV